MANETKNPTDGQNAVPEATDNAKQKPKIPFTESLFFKRFVAAATDVLLIVAINLVSYFMVEFVLSGLDTAFIQISSLVSGLIWLMGGLFLLLRDGPIPIAVFNYRSPGKFFLQLEITDLEKNPVTYKMSVERNLVVAAGVLVAAVGQILSAVQLPYISVVLALLVSLSGLVWLVMLARELWAMYKAPDNRRPGDVKAGTIVDYY